MAHFENQPKHIAFIMDGNGRWAENNGWKRTAGHVEGAKKVREVVKLMKELEVPYVTLYAFSTENWKRSRYEVETLMELLRRFSSSKKEIKAFIDAEIRVRFIGRRDRLNKQLLEAMECMEKATAGGEAMLLQVAVDYSGRDDLVRAFSKLLKNGHEVSELDITEALDTGSIPNPDMVIRTGGESRTSNFMVWQTAYSEWFFTETSWPEISTTEIIEMVQLFAGVERRFGDVLRAAE